MNNHEIHRNRAEELDPAFAALLRDLARRGLLDRTVVVCGGEFGRTPQVNLAGGRDHWTEGLQPGPGRRRPPRRPGDRRDRPRGEEGPRPPDHRGGRPRDGPVRPRPRPGQGEHRPRHEPADQAQRGQADPRTPARKGVRTEKPDRLNPRADRTARDGIRPLCWSSTSWAACWIEVQRWPSSLRLCRLQYSIAERVNLRKLTRLSASMIGTGTPSWPRTAGSRPKRSQILQLVEVGLLAVARQQVRQTHQDAPHAMIEPVHQIGVDLLSRGDWPPRPDFPG